MSEEFPDAVHIDLGAVRLAVHEAKPTRPRELPVVLLHGFPEIAYSWRHQIGPLLDAGWHVIAPDQRGYATSDRPAAVDAYDTRNLCGDVAALLDHFGYERGIVVGHDWGAILTWDFAQLHPERVAAIATLSVPFLERGEKDWVSFWEERLGGDFYIVHFNRQPGVAEAAFERDVRRFLGNLYRQGQWREPQRPQQPGMPLVNLAAADDAPGDPLLTEAELDVFVRAFETSGFTGPVNWYRNFARNWEILKPLPQRVDAPVLMIYGRHDIVPPNPRLPEIAPQVEIHTLDCGHWIQQEQPESTNRLLLDWLDRRCPRV